MLWSLIKILIFVAAIAGLTLFAGYLMESDGGVMITFAGIEYTLSPLISVMGLVALVVHLQRLHTMSTSIRSTKV